MSMLLRRRLEACFRSLAVGLFTTRCKEGESDCYTQHKKKSYGDEMRMNLAASGPWLLHSSQRDAMRVNLTQAAQEEDSLR